MKNATKTQNSRLYFVAIVKFCYLVSSIERQEMLSFEFPEFVCCCGLRKC